MRGWCALFCVVDDDVAPQFVVRDLEALDGSLFHSDLLELVFVAHGVARELEFVGINEAALG